MHFIKRTLPAAAVIAGLSLTPVETAQADSGDFIAGIAAGVVGAAIIGSSKKKKRGKKRYYKKKYSNPSVRGDANIQRALNAFGFDAGTPDGLFGKRTRAAISRYQLRRGDEASGYLTATQRAELLQAYARLGAANSGTVFAPVQPAPGTADPDNPFGSNGTTVATSPTTPTANTAVGSNASMAAFLSTLGSTTGTTTVAYSSEKAEPGAQAPAEASDQPLVVQLCDHPSVAQVAEVELRGGAENATNVFAQSFCTARSYALAGSAQLVGQSASFDPVGARSGCASYAQQQEPTLTPLYAQPAATVATDLASRMVIGTPEQTAQIADNFAVCLGLAQADGDMEQALSYATLLVGVGQGAYGELIAEHMALGLGIPQNTERAADWLTWTAAALDDGADPLIDVDDYDHGPLLMALAESAPSLRQDAVAYLEAVNKPAAAAATIGGIAFPNILDSSAAKKEEERKAKSAAMAPILGYDLQTVYGADAGTLLSTCKAGEAGQREIGTRTCAALAWAMQDFDFAEALDASHSRVAAD